MSMKEPSKPTAESVSELINALDDVTASLEIALPPPMPTNEGDRQGRWVGDE